MPRDPKPAGQRRRRNLDQPGHTKLGAGGGVVPGLPMEDPHPRTVEWWDAIWRSEMAPVWLESDRHELLGLADLKELQHRGEASASVLAEIRQLNDRFGLSPLARRRLAWELDQARGGEGAAAPVEQEGRWLRVVSD